MPGTAARIALPPGDEASRDRAQAQLNEENPGRSAPTPGRAAPSVPRPPEAVV
jgi:hypothetical protein